MLANQLKYDLLMFSRELFYLVFTVVVPPVTYLFMGELYGEFMYAGGLNYAETYTPSFILLITFGVVFFAFGFNKVLNRSTGVEKRISLAPVPKKVLLLSDILKSIIVTSFGYFVVFSLGMILYDLSFQLISFLVSYGFFILLNASLLIISSAIYSFFKSINGALVFSIVLFQVGMISGGFTMPIERMPTFVQVIADYNPLYHMNQLFIAVWNGQFVFESGTFMSIGYILSWVLVALLIIRFVKKVRD